MKTKLIITIFLLLIAFIAHVVGGEIFNIAALLNSNMPENLIFEIRGSWYIVGADFITSAIFLFLFVRKKSIAQNQNFLFFIGIRMLSYGAIFLILVIICNASMLFQVPQWLLLLIIGSLLIRVHSECKTNKN